MRVAAGWSDAGKTNMLKPRYERPRLLIALRGQRDVGPTGVLAGERPLGLTVSNEIQTQHHDRSIAAEYSPCSAALLQSARWASASCAAATRLSCPRHISKAGCWIARANENDSGQRGLHGEETVKTRTHLTNRVYMATNAFVTTDDVAQPAVKVRAHYIKIIPGDKIVASSAILYVEGGAGVLLSVLHPEPG